MVVGGAAPKGLDRSLGTIAIALSSKVLAQYEWSVRPLVNYGESWLAWLGGDPLGRAATSSSH
jgi:hypothetical protein